MMMITVARLPSLVLSPSTRVLTRCLALLRYKKPKRLQYLCSGQGTSYKEWLPFKGSKTISLKFRDTKLFKHGCSFQRQCALSFSACYSTTSLQPQFTVKNPTFKAYIESLLTECGELQSAQESGFLKHHDHHRLSVLEMIGNCYSEITTKLEEIKELDEMGKDKSLEAMVKEEMKVCQETLQELEEKLVELVTPSEDRSNDDSDVFLEVECGAGGVESMLFATEILNMYQQYADFRGWSFQVVSMDRNSSHGGIRKACVSVSGQGVYRSIKYEGGVHRVKRVPVTESGGRIHTSTITIAILLQPSEVELELKPSDLQIDTCRSSGPGGQNAQKTDSAVRIKHLPTGVVAECEIARSQIENKKMAMTMLRSRILEKEIASQTSQTVSQRRIQVGGKNRSERIRTYTFNHDTVTDHRLNKHVKNVDDFLTGGEALHEVVEDLQQEALMEALTLVLKEFEMKHLRQSSVKEVNR
ncbi:peptide chain release factor 1-like, mitochondrial [Mya arenaria]|uniref:peptide chain release factor 1-like, mitochondrial n=1 Tax=Mya arenaria TaxID=6604 RepID=UPI0022DEBAC7|nr:peptide chain release factor 1-like, mitochondrial [Mya arenaria]